MSAHKHGRPAPPPLMSVLERFARERPRDGLSLTQAWAALPEEEVDRRMRQRQEDIEAMDAFLRGIAIDDAAVPPLTQRRRRRRRPETIADRVRQRHMRYPRPKKRALRRRPAHVTPNGKKQR